MTNKTEAPDLKPCPFCGGDYQTWQHVRDGRTLGCSKCGARFTEYNGPPDNSAETRLVNAWNTRADLSGAKDKRIAGDAAQDYIDEMEARLTELEALVQKFASDPDYTAAYLAGVADQKARATLAELKQE